MGAVHAAPQAREPSSSVAFGREPPGAVRLGAFPRDAAVMVLALEWPASATSLTASALKVIEASRRGNTAAKYRCSEGHESGLCLHLSPDICNKMEAQESRPEMEEDGRHMKLK